MHNPRLLLALFLMIGAFESAQAVEGPSAAGPIGGTDVRSGMLPPPGVYGGTVQYGAATREFVDKDGNEIPALGDARLTKIVSGPFAYYVPDLQVLGGRVALGGFLPVGRLCGRFFATTNGDCDSGLGDPYVEFAWSRYFGTPRPSQYPGAYPIMEGLSVLIGFGMVVPIGTYDPATLETQARSVGTNIWDFSPTFAFTYTTRPWLFEGTEFSSKFYWNNYLENDDTRYFTGDLLNIDFALTEHIGRFQVGLAGVYALQLGDDRINGISIPPDGRRAEVIQVGGIAIYDMPETATSYKLKASIVPYAENTVTLWSVVFSWLKKF